MEIEVPPLAAIFWPGAVTTRRAQVQSKWNHCFHHVHFSALDYYAAVEEAVAHHRIPEVKVSRVTWRESGLISARREYLRLKRRQYVFDLCAAPFGTDFFLSSWLVVNPRDLTIWHFCGMAITLACCAVGAVHRQGTPMLLPAALFLLLFLLGWGGAFASFEYQMELSNFTWGLTIVGAVLEVIFRPYSYFEADTAAMFEQTVHAAMMEVIDEMTAAKGIPRLTDDERKPMIKEFWKK